MGSPVDQTPVGGTARKTWPSRISGRAVHATEARSPKTPSLPAGVWIPLRAG